MFLTQEEFENAMLSFLSGERKNIVDDNHDLFPLKTDCDFFDFKKTFSYLYVKSVYYQLDLLEDPSIKEVFEKENRNKFEMALYFHVRNLTMDFNKNPLRGKKLLWEYYEKLVEKLFIYENIVVIKKSVFAKNVADFLIWGKQNFIPDKYRFINFLIDKLKIKIEE